MTRGTRIAYKMFSLSEHPVSTTGIMADIILSLCCYAIDAQIIHIMR